MPAGPSSAVSIISGFHSPVEKECLRILLRGTCPIVISPARSLTGFRIPVAWQPHLSAGRLLVVSCFPSGPRRVMADTAHRRNEFVATLATDITVVHATPGGRLQRLLQQLAPQGRPITRLADTAPPETPPADKP